MERQGPAKLKGHRADVNTLDPVYADGLVMAPDHEVDRLFQFGMNSVHHGRCPLTHIEPQPDERAQPEQFKAEAVGTRSGPLL